MLLFINFRLIIIIGDHMVLSYQNKHINLIECKSFVSRLKGFMGKKSIDKALMFKNCNSIHTFFMKEYIDVILCDKNNNILYYYPNLKNNKIILPKKNVYIVYECPTNYFKFKINTKVQVIK